MKLIAGYVVKGTASHAMFLTFFDIYTYNYIGQYKNRSFNKGSSKFKVYMNMHLANKAGQNRRLFDIINKDNRLTLSFIGCRLVGKVVESKLVNDNVESYR